MGDVEYEKSDEIKFSQNSGMKKYYGVKKKYLTPWNISCKIA